MHTSRLARAVGHVVVRAVVFAAAAIAFPRYDLALVAVGACACALALLPALPGAADGRGGRVRASHLWGMDDMTFEHMALLVARTLGLELYRREVHGRLAMFAGRDPDPVVGGFVFVLAVNAPELDVAMVQALAARMRAHGTARGLVITSGVVGPAAAAAATPWRIAFVDGDGMAAVLNGEPVAAG